MTEEALTSFTVSYAYRKFAGWGQKVGHTVYLIPTNKL